MVVGAGSGRSGSVRANQMQAKRKAKECVCPVSMVAFGK